MYDILISTLRGIPSNHSLCTVDMVVIEYINVQTKNYWAENSKIPVFGKIVVAALLG